MPVPYTGAEPVAPAQVVAQESLPLPTRQAFAGARSGSILHVQLADGRILEVAVPPGTPPGHRDPFSGRSRTARTDISPRSSPSRRPLASRQSSPLCSSRRRRPAGAQPGVGVASAPRLGGHGPGPTGCDTRLRLPDKINRRPAI